MIAMGTPMDGVYPQATSYVSHNMGAHFLGAVPLRETFTSVISHPSVNHYIGGVGPD